MEEILEIVGELVDFDETAGDDMRWFGCYSRNEAQVSDIVERADRLHARHDSAPGIGGGRVCGGDAAARVDLPALEGDSGCRADRSADRVAAAQEALNRCRIATVDDRTDRRRDFDRGQLHGRYGRKLQRWQIGDRARQAGLRGEHAE